jgi:hypothetical protein
MRVQFSHERPHPPGWTDGILQLDDCSCRGPQARQRNALPRERIRYQIGTRGLLALDIAVDSDCSFARDITLSKRLAPARHKHFRLRVKCLTLFQKGSHCFGSCLPHNLLRKRDRGANHGAQHSSWNFSALLSDDPPGLPLDLEIKTVA